MSVTEETYRQRFDEFQKVAVLAITRDFTKKQNGRYLLVIPTGGGKTFTSVKAINNLFAKDLLKPDSNKVLWTAHRDELIQQAKDAFNEFSQIYGEDKSFANCIVFGMIRKVPEILSYDSTIKLVVIDEAHHGAAISYQPIFDRSDLGILGLTATPSRHDGKPLDFEKESYSIGFPDLVKKGVILKPIVRTIKGETYDFNSFAEEGLEQLNNKVRNKKIIDEIIANRDDYKKVIIYVGTKNHLFSLYNELIKSRLNEYYESISYVIGGGINSRNQSRDIFIEEEKRFKRSILVNVQVLTEGYDDPSVNTVIMATPTRSKLYYMQAMGRSIRRDPNNLFKKAIIVEVVDQLPNIRYRIDNRWLYADISDTLEPKVIDVEFSSETEFFEKLNMIYIKHNVSPSDRKSIEFDPDQRYTMLLFKHYRSPGVYTHYHLTITTENRPRVSNMFNFLSERMATFRQRRMNSEVAFKMLGKDGIDLIENEADRRCIYNAMENAVPDIEENRQQYVKEGYPWITFVAFQYRKEITDLTDDILEFVKEMVNKDDIIELIRTRNFETGTYLCRFPLPLGSCLGRIVTSGEFAKLQDIIQNLQTLKEEKENKDHRFDVQNLIEKSILPIELIYSQSLVLIVRDDISYSLLLE